MIHIADEARAFSTRAALIASTVKATAISGNDKVGKVATTQVSQYTCDNLGTPCPFRHMGCYGESGRVAMTSRVLEMASMALGENITLLDIAHAEADAIDGLKGNRPLRLHIVGDCPTDSGATVVSLAADRYRLRGGHPVWTYTHGWREVARSSWGGVSVLASCESVEQLDAARALGYACSMVTESHGENVKPYKLDNGMRAIPCREQVGASDSCTECRLCFHDDVLKRTNSVIVFETHGQQVRKAKAAVHASRAASQGARFVDLGGV